VGAPVSQPASRSHSTSEPVSRFRLLPIWLLVAVLIPLAVNPWGKHPFDLTKTLILRALVWIGVALWLVLPAKRRGRLPAAVRWSAVALAAAWLIATVAGASPGLNFWGSSGRNQGTITLITDLLLFILIATRLRGQAQAWPLLRALTLTTAPIVFIIVLERQGWTIIQRPGAGAIELSSTLGSPDAVGAYLALLLPLTVAMALHLEHGWQCRAVCGLSMAALGVVGLTLAREAWLTSAVGLATFGALVVWPRVTRRARKTGAAVIALALLLAAVALIWSGAESNDWRTAGILATRLPIWEASWSLIQARPWLGYGPNAVELVVPSVYPVQLAASGAHSLVIDQAANWFLDTWLATGLLGLLAWLGFLAACLGAGWQAMRRHDNMGQRLLLAAAMGAITGHLVGSLFSPGTTAANTVLWLLLGLLVALAREPRSTPATPAWLTRPLARAGIIALALLIVVETAARPLMADVAMRSADQQARAGLWTEAANTAARGVRLWPVELSAYLDASWICVLRAQQGAGSNPCLAHAEAYLLDAREQWPDNYRVHAALGELYAVWATLFDASQISKADAAYAVAVQLAPNHVSLHMAWGLAHAQMAQWEEAASQFRQAAALDPGTRNVYLRLGEAELALGHIDSAINAYNEALTQEPGQPAAYLGLSHCYEALGQLEIAAMWRAKALQQ
jgi:O-antigen ligase